MVSLGMKETFKQWDKRVDLIVTNKIGLGIDDLPDLVMRHDLYDDDMTPLEGAMVLLETWVAEGDVPEELMDC